MKKVITLFTSCLLLFSCANEDVPTNSPNRREIKLSAGLQTFITKAPGSSAFPANTSDVFSIFSMKSSPQETPGVPNTETYFLPTSINSDADGKLIFSEKRYYPSNDSDTLYFAAFAPSVTAENFSEGKNVKYVIDGSQDIIWARDDNQYTLTSDDDPTLNFHHKLMKITFAVKAATGFEDTAITSIKINNFKTNVTLDAIHNTMTWGDEVIDKDAFTGSVDIVTEVTDLTGTTILMEPLEVFYITVVAGDITYTNHKVTLPDLPQGQLREGMAHRVVLTFYPKDIGVDADLTDWGNGEDAESDMKV